MTSIPTPRARGPGAGLLLALTAAALPGAAPAVTIQTVALTGQSAPGTAQFYGGFVVPDLNAAGEVSFVARLKDQPGGFRCGRFDCSGSGVFSGGAGTVDLVARSGALAPDSDGAVFSRFRTTMLDAAGHTAFAADLAGGAGGKGVYSNRGGGLSAVARTGQAAPGTPGLRFSTAFDGLGVDDAGRTAVVAGLEASDGTAAGSGLFSEGGGSLGLVARTSEIAPGGWVKEFRGFEFPAINGAGKVAFEALLGAAGGSGGIDASGVWKEDATGSLAAVAVRGDTAPGGGGAVFGGFFGVAGFNDAGETVFESYLADPGTGASVGEALYAESGGVLHPVARDHQAAPGSGGLGFWVPRAAVINGAGQVAFRTDFDDFQGSGGIYLEGPGGLAPVVLNGDPAPGAGGDRFQSFNSPLLNAAGEVALWGTVTRVNGVVDRGIWIRGVPGTLDLLVATGSLLEVAPGDVREVSNFNLGVLSGNQDGRRSGFNDRGQLAFQATFVDGSEGIFVGALDAGGATLPEPSTGWMLALAALALGRRVRAQAASGRSRSVPVQNTPRSSNCASGARSTGVSVSRSKKVGKRYGS